MSRVRAYGSSNLNGPDWCCDCCETSNNVNGCSGTSPNMDGILEDLLGKSGQPLTVVGVEITGATILTLSAAAVGLMIINNFIKQKL